MFSFQSAVFTKIDIDGCKNAIETPQQALFLQYSVDFCFGKCVTDLPQLEFDVILFVFREQYRFFRESVLTYGMILAYHSEDRCFGECRSSFFVSNYIIRTLVRFVNW